jgi:hypothetical protein
MSTQEESRMGGYDVSVDASDEERRGDEGRRISLAGLRYITDEEVGRRRRDRNYPRHTWTLALDAVSAQDLSMSERDPSFRSEQSMPLPATGPGLAQLQHYPDTAP